MKNTPARRRIKSIKTPKDHFETFDTCGDKALSMFFDNTNREEKAIEWLNHSQAAQYLGLSKGALHNRTSMGVLTYYKLGRLNRFIKSDLDKFLLRNRKGYHVN